MAGDGGVVTGVINMDAQDGQDIRNSPLCADYAEGSIYHRGHREHGGFLARAPLGYGMELLSMRNRPEFLYWYIYSNHKCTATSRGKCH